MVRKLFAKQSGFWPCGFDPRAFRHLFILFVIVTLAACGISKGTVISKHINPEYDSYETNYGVCLFKDPKVGVCYQYLQVWVHHPTTCVVTIQNHNETADKYVDCNTYDSYTIGDYVAFG